MENYSATRKILLVLLNTISILGIIAAMGIYSYYWRFWYSNLVLIGLGLSLILFVITATRNRFSRMTQHIIKIKHVYRYSLLLLLILILLFSLTGFYRPYIPAPEQYTSSGTTDLKVLSYNIRKGNTPEPDPYDSWNERRDNLVEYIDGIDVDFLMVQEAYAFQLNYLANELESGNFKYTGVGREDGVLSGEHSAVFFDSDRFEFITGGSFWLSETPNFPFKSWGASNVRICSWGRFQKISSGDEVVVASVHYDFGVDFQSNASILLNQRMAEVSGGVPVILGGDFNMNRTMAGYEYLENYGEKPLFSSYHLVHGPGPHEIPTYNGFGDFDEDSKNMIDFVFVSGEIGVTSSEILQDTYIAEDGNVHYYSDHFPVLTTCRI